MDVNISETTQEPFNGIRFSIKGQNKTVKAEAEQFVSEAVSKKPEVINAISLNPEVTDGDSIRAYD